MGRRKALLPFGKRAAGALLFGVAVTLVALAYRWAEPRSASGPRNTGGGSSVAIHMQNSVWEGIFNGARAWSLRAESIDIEQRQGMNPAGVRTAVLRNIRDGHVYRAPAEALAGQSVAADLAFEAGGGTYEAGTGTPPPAFIGTYGLTWRFALTNGVSVRSASGDRITAPTVDIVEMVNRKTARTERRLFCSSGVAAARGDFHANAATALYNPGSRELECAGGVRGEAKGARIDAPRALVSFAAKTVLCPDEASGAYSGGAFKTHGLAWDVGAGKISSARETTGDLRGVGYRASSVAIDLKRHTIDANRVVLDVRTDRGTEDLLSLPAIRGAP